MRYIRFQERTMKRILVAVILIPLFCTAASAEWQSDFNENYTSRGIDQAVEVALQDGVGPDAITGQGRSLAGLSPQNLVKALYCAGVRGKDIRDAAANNGISDSNVTAGYKMSLAECRDAVAESKGYTPVAEGFAGSRRTGTRARGRTYGSPSTFQ